MSGDDDVRKPNYDAAAEKLFCEQISEHFDTDVVTVRQVNEFVKLNKLPYPHFLFAKASAKAGWGKYRVRKSTTLEVAEGTQSDSTDVAAQQLATVTPISKAVHQTIHAPKLAANITACFIPNKDVTYVPFGFYNDLKAILGSKIFYPIYITGLSGNGKTLMVEQVCANLKREFVRVNITKETDETDLIGSYELIDGNTVRREGPVLIAMRRGAVLLLDETDYGSERLLCLQPILEGKPFLDKKTGEVITPSAGFNVVATANTKGKGSDDGRFIGANVLNEAFLERFAITVEQEYPSPSVEKKILLKNFDLNGLEDVTFAEKLIIWAEIVRKSYADGAVDEIISTRRLVHITKAMSIFKNRMKAIELCLNRFDQDTKKAFLDLYTKVDAEAIAPDANMVSLPEVRPDIEFQDAIDKAFGLPQKISGFPSVISPTQVIVKPLPKIVTPVTSNLNVTNPAVVGSPILPKFASATVLIAISQKHNTKIEINFDLAKDEFVVNALGHETRISTHAANRYTEATPGALLDSLVSACAQKSVGAVNTDYRPIW